MTAPARRRTTTTTDVAVPSIVVPKGRSAAELRLGAVAALHQPVERISSGHGVVPDEFFYVCGECKGSDGYGRVKAVRWLCATARLMGPWPGADS